MNNIELKEEDFEKYGSNILKDFEIDKILSEITKEDEIVREEVQKHIKPKILGTAEYNPDYKEILGV